MRIQKNSRNPLKNSERKSSTGRSRARKMARKRVVCSRKRRRIWNYCSKRGEEISDKLEALKSLIPCNGAVKVEQLFQETADYIITLKTQAFVLQKLIEFYDHGDGSKHEKQVPIVQQYQP
ncbi:hypothetical protein HRI_000413400 [Hibiscus trionum]|uniref:BHLH domain-containing protein n=1 Tax=Hibiscus trionum TaxID=183268 RepID=A0A9W7GZ16_HIBTR|nr:hypothetical protein HRI_000413400 [Hibiscus trionum]